MLKKKIFVSKKKKEIFVSQKKKEIFEILIFRYKYYHFKLKKL
jgi:hypothetical protein